MILSLAEDSEQRPDSHARNCSSCSPKMPLCWAPPGHEPQELQGWSLRPSSSKALPTPLGNNRPATNTEVCRHMLFSLQIAMKNRRQFSKMLAQICQAPHTSHLASQGVGPLDKVSADHLYLSPNPFLNSNTAFKGVGIYTATSTCKFCIALYGSWKA